MTKMSLDYKKIGLKCGIEIHQQLEGKKLFCDCPTTLRDDEPNIKVKRYLRAAAGETGEIDIAAAQEQRKQKHFIYEAYKDTTCLVELDEEPPHSMNKEALNTALQAALMLKAKPVDTIQVMRKTVVDGSNTSGFQRTALVAADGIIKLESGDVKVPTICLEEDAAKIIKKDATHTIFRLDRLGIPLIEFATDPDIHTPEQAKEVAAYIGMILRSTGKAKRGLGTIRQDVNVSIKGGNRIEIKGAQDLKSIPLLVKNEAKRQLALLELKNELNNLKFKEINKLDTIDFTKTFKNTKCNFVNKAIKSKNSVIGFKLEKFNKLLGKELMPKYRFGTELAGHAKVFGFGGIIHSDENLEKYKFSDKEIKEVKAKLKIGPNDAFILVVGNEDKAKNMIEHALLPRINQTLFGVPKEVRKANQDATSTYLRPMPGAARMYPETDVKLEKPDTKEIKLPELIEEKIKRFQKLGLGKDLATLAAKSEQAPAFEKFIKEFKNIKPAFIAETLLSTPREIKRKFNADIDKLTETEFEEIFRHLDKGEITKDSVINILLDFCNSKFVSMDAYKPMSEEELKSEIKKIIEANKDIPFNALIGKTMAKLKGKADGKKIVQILKELS